MQSNLKGSTPDFLAFWQVAHGQQKIEIAQSRQSWRKSPGFLKMNFLWSQGDIGLKKWQMVQS
jgi:hypothetical protein